MAVTKREVQGVAMEMSEAEVAEKAVAVKAITMAATAMKTEVSSIKMAGTATARAMMAVGAMVLARTRREIG